MEKLLQNQAEDVHTHHAQTCFDSSTSRQVTTTHRAMSCVPSVTDLLPSPSRFLSDLQHITSRTRLHRSNVDQKSWLRGCKTSHLTSGNASHLEKLPSLPYFQSVWHHLCHSPPTTPA